MVDDALPKLAVDNIRSLLHFATQCADERLQSYRMGTRYEAVRPSDVRVFVMALRRPRRIADLARSMKISRQAVQMSVRRLQALKVLELQPIPGNQRDKLVVITDRGLNARRTAEMQSARLENEIAELLGVDGLEQFREYLSKISEYFGHREFIQEMNLESTD